MLSFSEIITLSSMAFGTLTQALPILQGNADINARNSGLIAPCYGGCTTLDGVFTGLKVQLGVELEAIIGLTEETVANVDINSILSGVCGILDDATETVNDLASLEIHAVLEGANGVVLTADGVLQLVSAVVDVVFEALYQVTVVVTDLTSLFKVLSAVVNSLYCLLQAVVNLTRVVFLNELLGLINGLLCVDVVVQVFAFLKLSIVIS